MGPPTSRPVAAMTLVFMLLSHEVSGRQQAQITMERVAVDSHGSVGVATNRMKDATRNENLDIEATDTRQDDGHIKDDKDVALTKMVNVETSRGQVDKTLQGKGGAKTTTTTTTTTTRLDMMFGGLGSFETMKSLDPTQKEVARPEQIKTEKCTPSHCEDCADKFGCWHGLSMDIWHTTSQGNQQGGAAMDLQGQLAINISAESEFSNYSADLWAKCGSGGGSWHIQKYHSFNGTLSLFRDLAPVDGFASTPEITGGVPGETEFTLQVSGETDTRIRVVFTPTAYPAGAIIYVYAEDVEAYVDECMGVQKCTQVLGGTKEGFAMRSDNGIQKQCLAGTVPQWLTAKCQEWKDCLTDFQKEALLAFLTAGSASVGAALVDVTHGNLIQAANPMTCMDPAVDDPESWECECLEHMMAACGGVNATCFKGHMCDSPHVCPHWKTQAACPEASLIAKDESGGKDKARLATLLERASMNSSDRSSQGVAGEERSAVTMDDSLAEKCEG